MLKKLDLGDVDFSTDYLMFSISGHLKDYRISHFLNQHLNINLVKKNDLHYVWGSDQEGADFSFYYYEDNDIEIQYHLITNRSSEGIVLPTLKNIDYLFFLGGLIDDLDEQKFISNIRKIPSVLSVNKINIETQVKKVKSEINRLLTDIELHVINNH